MDSVKQSTPSPMKGWPPQPPHSCLQNAQTNNASLRGPHVLQRNSTWPCMDLHIEIPMHAPIAKQVFSQSSVCVSVTSSLGTNSSDADVYTEPCFLWFQVKDDVMGLNTCGYLVYLALRLGKLLSRREGDICLYNITKGCWRMKQSCLVACNVRDVLYSPRKAWGHCSECL